MLCSSFAAAASLPPPPPLPSAWRRRLSSRRAAPPPGGLSTGTGAWTLTGRHRTPPWRTWAWPASSSASDWTTSATPSRRNRWGSPLTRSESFFFVRTVFLSLQIFARTEKLFFCSYRLWISEKKISTNWFGPQDWFPQPQDWFACATIHRICTNRTTGLPQTTGLVCLNFEHN